MVMLMMVVMVMVVVVVVVMMVDESPTLVVDGGVDGGAESRIDVSATQGSREHSTPTARS